MQFRVIAISRTLGAGGEDLGSRLADDLGFRYVDDEILDRAAALAGVSTDEISAVESRPGLLQRISDSLPNALKAEAPAAPAPESSAAYERLVIDVIRETAAMEFTVIVAHGASIALRGDPSVLRVLVTAPRATRAGRVAAAGRSADEAETAVEESDGARDTYFKRFYDLEHEHPTDYDLVINTEVLSIDQAAAVVLAAVHGATP